MPAPPRFTTGAARDRADAFFLEEGVAAGEGEEVA